MPLEDTSNRIHPVQALQGMLRAQGLDADDFEFQEFDSGFVDMLGSSGRIVSVRRRSTGEERLYATGPDSAWMGAFIMDIGSGHFGPVSRVAG